MKKVPRSLQYRGRTSLAFMLKFPDANTTICLEYVSYYPYYLN